MSFVCANLERPLLTKLLFTLAIITIMVFLLINRSAKTNQARQSLSSVTIPQANVWRRYGVRGLFVLLGLSIFSYSVWFWRDQHKVVTVTIMPSNGTNFSVYHARKGDISETKMVTVEGLHIRFSSSERLEILED